MEEKRRGRISFVGLPVQPMRSMPLRAACDLVREKLTLLFLELELADDCVENWMLSVVCGRNYII